MTTDSVIDGIAPRIDRGAFLAAETLEARVDLVNRVAGTRLYSHYLALVWAEWLVTQQGLSKEESARVLREMLVLSPNHDQVEGLMQPILGGWESLEPATTPVFMIISCEKYLGKARLLRTRLTERGALAWIVTGDHAAHVPRWHDEGCVVPAADTYEALPLKVAKGVEAMVERYGPCSVVKIDDDCVLTGAFSVKTFAEVGTAHDYAGVPCSDPMHDRLWHHGKTSRPMGVYTRRFHGAWARGACYLLGPLATALIAREVLRFPGEFACEYYEDKAVGDFLRGQGVKLSALSSDAQWGISFDAQERYVPPADANATRTDSASVALSPVSSASAVVTSDLSRQRIPKVLHLTWVGDESKRPDNCIKTWVELNPGWTVKVWGNADLQNSEWINARHMKAMWNKELNGVADLMRWEILYNEGGIVVDADSICVRPLDDWLLEADAIACWENEISRPRLIACNMIGSIPENPFIGQIIQDLNAQPTVVHDMAWKTVGPLCITTAYFKYAYTGLTILPSHFFIPDHFSGVHYGGGGIVYAKQEWASTHGAYDTLHLKKFA